MKIFKTSDEQMVHKLFQHGVLNSDETNDMLWEISRFGFTSIALDVRWNDIAQQLIDEKKGVQNENKSQDSKCTCPTYKLGNGCPRLRGESTCQD